MSTVTVSIGLTRREDDYSPMVEGWRPGARAWRVLLHRIDLPTVDDPTAIPEAVFVATNAPARVIAADPLALPIHDALIRRRADAYATPAEDRGVVDRALTEHFRSLSVGDTVTVTYDGGRFRRTYACDHTGWTDVTAELEPGAASDRRRIR